MPRAAKLLGVCAALLGFAGAALAAGASHALAGRLDADDMRRVWIAAGIALAHAPALLAIALRSSASRTLSVAGLSIALGALVFCASLAARALLGVAPVLAPLGGVVLMLGWLILAFSIVRE